MRTGLIALTLSLFIAIPAATSAETVFTYAPDGGSAVTFSLDELTAVGAAAGKGMSYEVPGGAVLIFTNPAWAATQGDGPAVFEFSDFANNIDKIYEGPQLYSGSESSPIFTAGIYQLTADSDFANNTGTATFTIADVATVPEPSSLLLLGTGVAGAIEAARRRRKVAIRYPWRASN